MVPNVDWVLTQTAVLSWQSTVKKITFVYCCMCFQEGLRPGDSTSTFCGTPNYIAPEMLRGEDYGRHSNHHGCHGYKAGCHGYYQHSNCLPRCCTITLCLRFCCQIKREKLACILSFLNIVKTMLRFWQIVF